jgi:penicillin-binding protein 2
MLNGFRIVLFLVFSILVARAAFLQVMRGGELRAYAEQNRLKREVIPALRGIITDRDGAPLAFNVPAFSVELYPRELPRPSAERMTVLDRIALALGLTPELVRAAAASGQPDTVVLQSDMAESDALKVGSALAGVPGIEVVSRASRKYRSRAFAPVVGYVGRVSKTDLSTRRDLDPGGMVGRSGLEAALDSELAGDDGYRAVERDSANQILRTVAVLEPTAGASVTLTLDAALQEVATRALDSAVARVSAPGGALVALDPQTGAVLALVSSPTFDPTALAQGLDELTAQALFRDPRHPFLNRPIAGEYPSGSTIKPVIAAEALDRGVITPQTTVLSTGGLSVGGSRFPDWKPGGHGITDVKKALAESVNTFFYYIGGGYDNFQGLGVAGLLDGFTRFGFGVKSGIDLTGEANGYLPTSAVREKRSGTPWYLGDTYHLSIGQGPLAVTPLQIANATAAIANGGTVWRPYLATTLTDPTGQTRVLHVPEAVRRGVVKPSSLETVVAGMRQGVASGSSRALSDLAVPFAGKTGTAQFGDGTKTHAWFTAFGPVPGAKIVITVLVEAGGEGHDTALPVAREVLRWWIANRAQS